MTMPKQAKQIEYKENIDVTPISKMGGDYMVVAAARVSTNGDEAMKYAAVDGTEEERQKIAEENKGLIKYLMKHRHGTPFEHSALTFYVRAPIFVWREWHRHRIGKSYNEESGRYKELDPVFYLPDRERPMMKVEGWKPGRPKFLRCDNDDTFNRICTNLKHSYSVAYEAYQDNLSLNIDPGLARDCLPVGIYSGCWVTCNPRSIMHFLSLRINNEEALFVSYPLWEIQVAAEQVEVLFKKGWPITYEAFCENRRVGP